MQTINQSYFWFLLTACFGATIVLLGICMEVAADKKWFKNISALRFWESVKHWGGILVIVGIAIEVVDAGFVASESWQIKKQIAETQTNLAVVGKTANETRDLVEINPKTVKKRLKILLNGIDNRVLPALKNGQTDFSGMIPESEMVALEAICAESNALKYINVFPTHSIDVGADGSKRSVRFILSTNLLDDAFD